MVWGGVGWISMELEEFGRGWMDLMGLEGFEQICMDLNWFEWFLLDFDGFGRVRADFDGFGLSLTGSGAL